MLIKDIKKVLLGKTLSSYDEWYGESKNFVIGFVSFDNGRYIVAEHKDDTPNKVSMTKEELAHLIEDKYSERRFLVDHCPCRIWFRIIC